MRLDKYLVQSSVGTRKKVRNVLANGRIAVNGSPVRDATTEIDTAKDMVTCDGLPICHRGSVYYMFHKPKGCITARSDAFGSRTVLDYFQDIDTEGVFMVGRLDKDTEGLLLLTNDGELDHQLMSPQHHVTKQYFFWATGELTEENVAEIEAGIVIEEGGLPTKPASLQILNQGMYHEYAGEIGIRLHDALVVSGLLTISEGQKHQVKRMLRAVGCRVVLLKRLAIGGLKLDASLLPGEYRELTRQQVEAALDKKDRME